MLLTAVPFLVVVRLGGCPTPTTRQVTGGGPPLSKFYEDRDILPFQASTEQHPAHRAPPGLGDQPHHQTAERGEGWDGETGPEDHQHISQRTRYRAIRKHRPTALTRVNQTPSMLPSFPPGPRTRATGGSRTITEQDHQKVRNTSHLVDGV